MEERLRQYAAQGVNLTYEQAMDEVAADEAGLLMDGGKALDDFIRKHRTDRTLLEKIRDAIRSFINKLTGREKRQAQTAEGKLTAALEAAEKRAKALQDKAASGTMDVRYSAKGKYWRPNLTQNEWTLLNRHMEQEISDSAHTLDEATKWLYADEKGVQVFALYGIGDGTEATPLYAVGGKKAAEQYEVFKAWMEGSNGKFDRSRESFNRVFENIKRKSRSAGNGISSPAGGTAANEDVRVSFEERGGNRTRNSESGAENRRVNSKFSLKAPVEETRDLVAVHNLTEEKLLKTLRLGGMPMPSIAVVKAEMGHTDFGDITLVMDKRSIDPKTNRKNTVYSADAWTPTVPRTEYEANPVVEERVYQTLSDLSKQVAPYFQRDLSRVMNDIEGHLNRENGEDGLVQYAMDNPGMKAAYLEQQGKHVAEITKQVEEERAYKPERAEKYQAVIDILGTKDPAEIGAMPMKQLRDAKGAELEKAFPGMTKSALRMGGILQQVQAYLRDQAGETRYRTITDSAAMEQAVEAAVDEAGYEKWVKDLFSGIVADSGVYNNKERLTPSGNQRTFQQTHYPATLEGITKAMAGQNNGNSRNVSGFYGVKSLRAGTAERFRSIADIHETSSRLQNLTQKQIDVIQDKLNSRLFDLITRVAETSRHRISDQLMLRDAIGEILMEVAEGGQYTIDSIQATFNEKYDYQVGEKLAADIRDLLFDVTQMPVNLFEAKPERAVGFDEVLAAVIPSSAGEELRSGLEQAGVRTLEYEAGNEADRLAKVNSVDNARFSLKKTDGNRTFVEVEEDILDGVPEKDWVSTVKQNLGKKFPNGITIGNNEIHIDGQSRQEMTFSRYMQWLYNNDRQLHGDKLRATNNSDEILHAATDWVNEGLNHPRKDRITDFARGEVLLRVGSNDYTADVVVGTRKNGTMILYDVLNLQPTSFTEKETNAAISTNPSPGAARSTASVSNTSVSEKSENVNGNFSLKAGTLNKNYEAVFEENGSGRCLRTGNQRSMPDLADRRGKAAEGIDPGAGAHSF